MAHRYTSSFWKLSMVECRPSTGAVAFVAVAVAVAVAVKDQVCRLVTSL